MSADAAKKRSATAGKGPVLVVDWGTGIAAVNDSGLAGWKRESPEYAAAQGTDITGGGHCAVAPDSGSAVSAGRDTGVSPGNSGPAKGTGKSLEIVSDQDSVGRGLPVTVAPAAFAVAVGGLSCKYGVSIVLAKKIALVLKQQNWFFNL